MELCELYALKAQYEQEQMLANAKVAVITDIIEKAEAQKRENEQTEICEQEQIVVSQF